MARVGRVLIILAIAATGVMLAGLLAAHTPWARARALAWASGFVTRYHLELEAGSLGYNALTRRITLADVRLAAEGHHDRPFLVASRIEVRLPWSVFRRQFAIDHLVIDGGVVDIVRDEHDVTNLPPSSDAPTPEQPRKLDVRSLTLNGLDVQYEDQLRHWGVKVPRIESELIDSPLGASGTFGVAGTLAFHLRDRVMTMSPFETAMTFDGSSVQLTEASLSSSEIAAFLSGRINRVLDSPSFDLSLKGTVDLDNAIQWVPPPPVPITGMATIEGSITGPARAIDIDLRVQSNTLGVGRERDLGLAGPLRVTFDAFTGHDLVLTPRSGGTIRAQFAVPWGGAAISTAAAEWEGLDSQATFRLANIDPLAIGATFEGKGTFEFGEPRRLIIDNRAIGKPGRGLVPLTGTIAATIVGDDYQFDHKNSFPGVDFDGRMSGRFNRTTALLTTMNGPAHARVSDVGQAAASIQTLGFPMADIILRTHGALDAPLTLGGSFRYPEVETEISGDAVELPFLGAVRTSAHVVANTKLAAISAIDLRQGANAITGDVTADITGSRWSGRLHVDAPDAAAFQSSVPEEWRAAGHLAADAVLGGSFDNPQLDTTIAGTAIVFAGQAIDRVTAKALIDTTAIDVTSIELHQGAGFMDGRVRYAWDNGAYEAKLKGDRLSWKGTLLSPNDTQAIFALQFDGAGTIEQPKGQARIDFALSGGDAGTFIGAGDLTADLLGDQARIVATLPEIGAVINADVATATPYDYRVSAQLDRFELQRLSPFLGAIETEILGFANGNITASGRFADDRDRVAFVNITDLDAGIGGVPVTLNAPLNAELRGDDVSLKDLFLRVGSGKLSASGSWNTRLDGTFRAQYAGNFQDAIRLGRAFGVPPALDGTGALTFDVQSNGSRVGTTGTLSLSAGVVNWGRGPALVRDLSVNAALDGERLSIEQITGNVATGGVVGSFSAKGSATIPQVSLAAVDGAIVLDSAKFTFSGIPVEQQRPSRIELSKGAVTIADASWLVAENAITFGGSVGVAEADPTLDLSIKGLVDLRILSAFTSAMAFDGTANVDTRIAGTRSNPQLDGGITLDDVQVAISEPRVVLSELAGQIALRGQVVRFNDVRGLANGGSVVLDGPIEFKDLALSGGALNIQAQGVALEIPKGLRSELDALVTFRPDPRSPSLTGDVRVVQSSYTETITIAALARQAAMPATVAQVERPYLDRLQLDLSVTTTGDVTVDNNYGRLAAGADVRVVGTAARPGMEGRISLREGGQIFLAGRTFRITRGDISFADRRHIHPEFNIAAEANLGGGTGNVTLTLTGTLERPTVDLTSEQGSRTPGELAAQIVGSNNTGTALTLLSADLLGVTGRAIGLDAFRVERGDFQDMDFDYRDDPTLVGTAQTDPTTRLTVGKRLSDQVEFTVSQNLRENGKATFVISYFPKHNVELRAVSKDTGTLAVSARHQITFGGGVTKTPSELRVRPKISGITITGIDAAGAEAARAVIKLKVGDEFDFLKLQREIDRLQEDFHKQGHLEARIRTRRTDSDDASTVAVEFVITPGPRTTLEITGMTAPPSLVRELEEAWHQNAFDSFLIEDLTHRVRQHLVTTGDLGSIVVGLIDRPAPESKRLRIEVTPGAPVTDREIRFAGNIELDATRLRTEIQRAGVELEAWLDRKVVERALTQAYNEEGFLKAVIAAKPLTIDGSTGVLMVDITEGPRAQITGLKWAGVGDARVAGVEKAAALRTPTPFVSAVVNEARAHVEDFYSAQGFNAADVEVEPSIAADDTVTLTFTVSEGQQQILQGVELSGNEQTAGKVLTQALRFELGKPVDLDEWARARKRLYDTNVFRLVDIQALPAGPAVDGVQQVKAAVRVEEYPRWSFRYGVQLEGEREVAFQEFTSARNLGVVAELRTPNLFGRALSSGLFGLYERDRRDATLYLATSRLFGWRARTTFYAYANRDLLRDDVSSALDFITDSRGVSVDQRWRPRGFQFVYGYRFERNHTYDPDPGNDPLPFDIIANLAKFSTAVLFDRRDDPINPRVGSFSSVSFDNAAQFLGSDVQNRKLLLQQFVFLPLAKIVFATRAQLGMAFGRDELLPSDKFRAGGGTSVRGYGEDSLGPQSLGVPSGGDRLIVLNQEMRFPMFKWVNGVLFIDAGNIFGRGQDWGSLQVGYGGGLRFNTPIGLLRADIGFPAQQPALGKRVRYTFGIGHIF